MRMKYLRQHPESPLPSSQGKLSRLAAAMSIGLLINYGGRSVQNPECAQRTQFGTPTQSESAPHGGP